MNAEHISITIDTANDAFVDSPATEVARILRDLADRFEQGRDVEIPLRDINGNTCGAVSIHIRG